MHSGQNNGENCETEQIISNIDCDSEDQFQIFHWNAKLAHREEIKVLSAKMLHMGLRTYKSRGIQFQEYKTEWTGGKKRIKIMVKSETQSTFYVKKAIEQGQKF